MGLRTWVKRKFGKAEVPQRSYPLRPNPWAEKPQTIPVPGGYANDRIIEPGDVQPSSAGAAVVSRESWEDRADEILGDREYDSFLSLSSDERLMKISQLQALIQTIEDSSGKAELWRQCGRLFHTEGDTNQLHDFWIKALTSYEKAIEFKPDFHEAWASRGNSLDDLGRYEKAIVSYDKAIEFKPDYHEAWANRGISLSALGRKEEAIASYDKAIEFKPDLHEAWSNRGNSLDELGRKEEAIASYDKAIEFKPDKHEAWYNRGIASASSRASHPYPLPIILNQRPANLHHKHPELSQRGYDGQVASLTVGLTYCPTDTHPLGHGFLQHELGDVHFKAKQFSKAYKAYQSALAVLTESDFPTERLLTLQQIIRLALTQTNIPAARQYQIEGSNLYEILRRKATDQRTFDAKFSTFRLTEIDLLIGENEPVLALKQAEFYKNRALTWLLDPSPNRPPAPNSGGADPKNLIQSPPELGDLGGGKVNYEDRWRSLSERESIVYWHQSNDAITTFILTNDNAEPIVLNCDRYQQYKRFITWKNQWDNDYDDYRSKKSAMQSDHPWRQQMSDRLKKLKEILNIDAIEQHLPNTETLILVPHRDLHRYPIHTLFDRPTTHAPSIQAIDGGGHGEPCPDKFSDRLIDCSFSLLTIADPETAQPAMPYARLESALLQTLVRASHPAPLLSALSPEAATLLTTLQSLQTSHHHFHFTGHGIHDPQFPNRSALQLKNNDLLTANTIAQLDLSHQQLAILAACETAIVTTNDTSDYIGIQSAFLRAGTRKLLSTLWNIDEIASTWFIIHFYQQILKGTKPSIALTQTQTWIQTQTWEKLSTWLNQILEDHPRFDYRDLLRAEHSNILENQSKMNSIKPPYAAPYYWSSFTLTGI